MRARLKMIRKHHEKMNRLRVRRLLMRAIFGVARKPDVEFALVDAISECDEVQTNSNH